MGGGFGGSVVTQVSEGRIAQGFLRGLDVGELAEFLNRSAISVSRCTSASRAAMHSSLLPCGPVNRPHARHTETICAGTVGFFSTDADHLSNWLAVENWRKLRPTCQR